MVTRNVAHTGRTILTDRFKYTVYNDDPTALLFDLHNDPSETENLAGKPAHAETVSEHRALIKK